MGNTFGNRPGAAIILLDDDSDFNLHLPPTSGEWPAGTTAWLRFYNQLEEIILQLDAAYQPLMLAFTLQSNATPVAPKDIPEGSTWKIVVSLPTSPNRTEAPVWVGSVEK